MKKIIILNAFLLAATFFNNVNAQCSTDPYSSPFPVECVKAYTGRFIQELTAAGCSLTYPGSTATFTVGGNPNFDTHGAEGFLSFIVSDQGGTMGGGVFYPSISLGSTSFQNALVVNSGGYVTIGGAAGNRAQISEYKLFVKDGIRTERVKVDIASANAWADYVFAKNYQLPTLVEVEKQIKENGHLQNVPSAEEVVANGVELGEMAKIQLEKIEELTLYLIEQNKINQAQSKEIAELKAMVKALIAKQ